MSRGVASEKFDWVVREIRFNRTQKRDTVGCPFLRLDSGRWISVSWLHTGCADPRRRCSHSCCPASLHRRSVCHDPGYSRMNRLSPLRKRCEDRNYRSRHNYCLSWRRNRRAGHDPGYPRMNRPSPLGRPCVNRNCRWNNNCYLPPSPGNNCVCLGQ